MPGLEEHCAQAAADQARWRLEQQWDVVQVDAEHGAVGHSAVGSTGDGTVGY